MLGGPVLEPSIHGTAHYGFSKDAVRDSEGLKGLSESDTLKPNAAGSDIGATEIFVAVPPDRDVQPVRFSPPVYGGFALFGCHVDTAAVESTGMYRIPLTGYVAGTVSQRLMWLALGPSFRFQQRDEGVPRRPGGPPYLRCCRSKYYILSFWKAAASRCAW